jgi:hypothetical protein
LSSLCLLSSLWLLLLCLVCFVAMVTAFQGAVIATGYELEDRNVGVRLPVGSRFSLLHVVQTGSGAHPASYPRGTGGLFPRG